MDVINPHRFSTAAPAVDFDGFGNASRYFDGVSDYIDLGDSDDFSFGDGSNDSPFSVCAWVNMDDATNFRILTKFFSATTAQEWQFVVAYDDRLYLMLYDDDGSTRLGRRSNEYYTSNQGSWIHFSCTYDGSSISSGISLYRTLVGGSTTQVDAVDASIGNYSAMHNTTANVHIGRLGDFTTSSHYANGNIADVRIYNKELSSAEVQSIADGENITTNLIGHWLKDTPSLLDHSGTSDGTNNGSAFAYDNPSPAVEFGKASRVFNGTSNYIETTNTVSIGTGSMSWSVWAKTPSLFTGSSVDTVARVGDNGGTAGGNSPYDGLHLLFYQNKLTVYFAEFTNYGGAFIYQTSSTYNTNQWYHICGVLNASTQKLELYVDGVLDGSVDVSAAYPWNLTATKPPTIGVRLIGATYRDYFAGSIADVRLYDDALSSTDALALYNGTHVETNLIGHWLTNPDDVKDYAGSNNGTNNGSTYSFDNPLGDGGQYGSASRYFDGIDDGVAISNSAFPTGDFSISCWVKRLNTGFRDIVTIWKGSAALSKFAIMFSSASKFIFYYVSNTSVAYNIGNTTPTISNNVWYHIGVTYENGVAAKLFVDGVEVDSETVNVPTLQSSVADLYIGNRDDAVASFDLQGNIADVRIYDTAITGTDMYDLSRGYDFRTNLVGQWLTNQDDVDDYAGSNNGTNNGSIYSQDAPL